MNPVLVGLAIVLLVVGIVTLGLGVFGNALAWVYVSVGATALAGVPLFVLYRRGRRQGWPELEGTPPPEEVSGADPAPGGESPRS